MPYSVCWMMFDSRAEAYEAAQKSSKDDMRYATKEDYDNWI